ncbi:hypothetical protein ABT143_05490 [Streptomyces sp. NPDC002033]|uniref:hypothetical protein n=1 Tax=unclassified Streptomyces TaxID=2593676 RepID=UPI00331FEC4E
MRRIKAAVLAALAMTGLTLATVPARAADHCTAGGGGIYICEYGVTKHALPGGEKEQFLVGTDYMIWTRYTTNGKWSGWTSLGGPAKSAVGIQERPDPGHPDAIMVYATSTWDKAWGTVRMAPGQPWSPWDCLKCPE